MQQEQYFDLCQSFIVNLLSSERDSNVIRECLKVIKDLNLSHEIVKAAVMEALKNRQLAGSRELAVETLMHIAMEDPRTLDSLKQVANDSNRAVRLEAREALRKLDPQYAAGLAQIPDIDSDPLAFLTDDDPQVLAQALTRFAYKFVPSQDYLDENADKVDLLIELLHRPYTARCLAQFGHRAERAIVPLLNLLETAPDQTTAQAIGKLAATSSSGKKLLQEKFLCENFAASWASSRILAELAPEDCLQLLRPALDSQSSTVLFYALKQICDLKLKEDFLLPLIMEMIDNEQLNSPEISILVGPCTITEQMTPRTLMVEILAFYFDTEGVSEKISTLRLDPNLLVMAKASKVYEYGSNSQNLRAVQWNVPKLRAEGNEPRSAPPPPRPPSAPDDPGGS